MNMELITSAASDALVNVVLAIIALAGAYGVYYIRLGAAKLKEQTAQIKDEAGRKVLEDALDDVVNLATVSVGAMEQTTAKALRDAVACLEPGGRLCVITFHSLEDRLVKNKFRRWATACTCPPEFPVCVCGGKAKAKLITRKPIEADTQELEENRRSRSAHLRVLEKC